MNSLSYNMGNFLIYVFFTCLYLAIVYFDVREQYLTHAFFCGNDLDM